MPLRTHEVHVAGRDVTITTDFRAHVYVKSPEGESRFVDLEASFTGAAPGGGLEFTVDVQPIIDAIKELELDGAMERERGLELERRLPKCPTCGEGWYESKSPGGTETWTCGHAIGK